MMAHRNGVSMQVAKDLKAHGIQSALTLMMSQVAHLAAARVLTMATRAFQLVQAKVTQISRFPASMWLQKQCLLLTDINMVFPPPVIHDKATQLYPILGPLKKQGPWPSPTLHLYLLPLGG